MKLWGIPVIVRDDPWTRRYGYYFVRGMGR